MLVQSPPSQRKFAILVNGDRQHIGIVIENVLSAIAVMDVPVNNRNAFCQPARLSITDRDTNIVEQAEAHSGVWERVVPRRSHQCICAGMTAGSNRGHRLDHSTSRDTRNVEGSASDRRGAIASVAT